MRPSRQKASLRDRLRRLARTLISGPLFQAPAAGEWPRWSEDMAAAVVEIAQGAPNQVASSASLAVGSAAIPLGEFFGGSTPDKPLVAQVVRLGDVIELVALSAEATVEWQGIIDTELPVEGERIRLYAGYLGALFGYLPTAIQIPQGGYEVEGFQPLFGLSGKFDAERITPAVIGCIRRAFDDLELAAARGERRNQG